MNKKTNEQERTTKKNTKSPFVVLIYITGLIFSISICYKFIVSDLKVDFKFNDILTLFISLFSIAISIAFYFKTTETSNRFYDNANHFTTDIRTTLSSIESGFREMLQNIQTRNFSIESKIDNIFQIKEKVKKETDLIEETEVLKEEIIKEFAAKNNAKTEEINELLNKLGGIDDKIFQQQQSIANLIVKLEETNGKKNSTIVRIEKLSELKNAINPNNIKEGYITEGSFIKPPQIGERFWVGSFSTSPVQEIMDKNTFKTRNSIYRWSIIS